MKKVLATTALAFSLIGLTGCMNSTPNFDQCKIDGVDAPSWVCDGGATMEGGLFAVGSAAPNPLGIGFQRTEATAAARDALARQISVKVKNMFKQFQATTGIGDDQTAEKVTQNVSKQVTYQTLNKSKIIKVWMSPKKTLYVLIKMPDSKTIKQEVKKTIKTTLHNEQSLWQEFKSKKADAELEAAVDKEFGGNN